LKFSPQGTLLMALGKPAERREPGYFYQPNDVLTAPNGDIFVSEGHVSAGSRILKFDKSGKFLMQFGKSGRAPESSMSHMRWLWIHAGGYSSETVEYSGYRSSIKTESSLKNGDSSRRPSGVYIDENDVIYVADSESSATRNQADWKRGIRIGKRERWKGDGVHSGSMERHSVPATTAAEGVTADAAGNVYGSEVTEQRVQKYLKNAR
jgi:streptogramin lyase